MTIPSPHEHSDVSAPRDGCLERAFITEEDRPSDAEGRPNLALYLLAALPLLLGAFEAEGTRRPALPSVLAALVASLIAGAVYFVNREQLRRLRRSETDGLTDLGNRRRFHADLLERMNHARGAGSLVVTYLDINGLKRVNDTRGHGAGDAALRDVADLLRTSAHSSRDGCYRVCGDEFVLLTHASSEHRALRHRQRLRLLTKQVNGLLHGYGVSAAVVIGERSGSESALAMLRRMDACMSVEKRAGHTGAGASDSQREPRISQRPSRPSSATAPRSEIPARIPSR